MPTGLIEYESDGIPDLRRPGLTGTAPRLPISQADPFLRSIIELKESGYLPKNYAQSQINRSLAGGQVFNAYGGLFDPGSVGVSPELDDIARQAAEPVFDQLTDAQRKARFLPAADTEPGGFFALLEYFQVFNYAIAGGFNALINLAQGEEDETNVFLEAWEGFTLQDKETFSSVFENLGWHTQEGTFGYYARGTLGFIADVILDPTTWIGLGSLKSGKLLAAGITEKAALGRVAVQFGNGTKMTPLQAIAKVSKKISDEVADGATKGGRVALSSNLQTQLDASRLTALKNTAVESETLVRQMAEGANDITVETFEAALRDTFEEGVRNDVEVAIGRLFHTHGDEFLEKAWRESEGDLDLFFSRIGDAAWTKRIASELLELEGRELNWQNVFDLMRSDPEKSLKYKYLDPGGVKIVVPFSNVEWSLVTSQTLDMFKFDLATKWGNAWARIAERTGKLVGPDQAGFRGAVGKVGVAVGGFAKESAIAGLERMGKVADLFGRNRGRSTAAKQLLVQHDADMRRHISRAVDLAKESTFRNGKKIDQELNDMIYDVLDAEQDDALQWIMKARSENLTDPMSTYTPKHLPNLRDKVLGYVGENGKKFTEEDADFAVSVAENLKKIFDDAFETAEKAGTVANFLEYYLPMQYSGIETAKKLVFRDKPIATDADPFTLVRQLTRKQRQELKLEPVKDLTHLAFARIFAVDRAISERAFILDMARKFSTHSEQILDVMSSIHAPTSEFSQMLVAASRRQLGTEVYEAQRLMAIVPGLRDFYRAVQTGDADGAAAWLNENQNLISDYLTISPDDAPSFIEALTTEITTNVAAVRAGSKFSTQKYHGIIQRVRENVRPDIQKLVDDGVPLEVGRGLSLALEEAVLKKLGITGATPEEFRLRDLFQTSGGLVKIAKDANVDVLRLTILDESMSSVEAAKNLPPALLKQTDEIADQIVEAVRHGGEELSAKHSGYVEQMARMQARFFWTEVFETAVEEGGAWSVKTTFNGEQIAQNARHIRTLLESGEIDKASEESLKFFDQFGNHELVKTIHRQYREEMGIADELPWGELSREKRAAFFDDVFKAAKGSQGRTGTRYFERSVYKTLDRDLQKVINRDNTALREWVGKLAGENKNLYQELIQLLTEIQPLRTGFHFHSAKAIDNAITRAYSNAFHKLDVKLHDIIESNAPQAVIDAMGKSKILGGGIVRDTAAAPIYLNQVTKQVVKRQTQDIVTALKGFAEAGGVDPRSMSKAASAIEEALYRVNRFGDDINQTEMLLGIDEVVRALETEMVPIFEGFQAGEMARAMFDDHLRELGTLHRNGIELIDQAKDVQFRIARMNSAPPNVLGQIAPEEITGLLEELDGLQQQFLDMADKVGEQAADMMQEIPHPSTLGASVIEKYLADHPTLGNMKRIIDAMRRDPDLPLSEADKAMRAELDEMFKAAVKASDENLAQLETGEQIVREMMDRHRDKLRSIETARSSVVGRSVRYVNSLLTFALGRETNILSRHFKFEEAMKTLAKYDTWRGAADVDEIVKAWAGMGVADIFFDVGEYSTKGWQFAVEKFAEEGPKNPTLRKVWEKHFAKNRSSEYRAILDAYKFMDDGVLLPGTETGRAAVEWKKANSLNVPVDSPGVQRISEAAAKVILEDEEFSRLIFTEGEDFLEVVEKRAAQILRERSPSTGWFNEFAADVFLGGDEMQSAAKAMREEAALIQAYEAVIKDRVFRNQASTKTVAVKIKRWLQRNGFEDPELEASRIMQSLRMQTGLGDVESTVEALRDVGLSEGLVREAVRAFEANTELEQFLGKFRRAVDAQYDGVFAALGDVDGLAQIQKVGGDVPVLTVMREKVQNLAEYDARIDPVGVRTREDLQALVDALQDIDPVKSAGDYDVNEAIEMIAKGDARTASEIQFLMGELDLYRPGGSAYAKRAQYWLWRMGFVSDNAPRAGTMSVTPKARKELIGSMVRFAKDGHVFSRYRTASEGAQKAAASTAQQFSDLIESSAFAKAERKRWDSLKFQENSKSVELRFGIEDEEKFRSIELFRRYMHYQRLHHEATIFRHMANLLPSRADRQLLALRTLSHNPEAASDSLVTQRLLGIGQEGVVEPSVYDAASKLGVVEWEALQGAMPELVSKPSQAILKKHAGIEVGDAMTREQFLEELIRQRVSGVTKTVDAMTGEASYELTRGRIELPAGLTTPSGFDSAVREVDGYLALLQDTDRASSVAYAQLPATESQVNTITDLLRSYVQKDEEASAFLMSLTGSVRADELSFLEAAYVIDNIESGLMANRTPDTGKVMLAGGIRPEAALEAKRANTLVGERPEQRGAAMATSLPDMRKRYDDVIPVDPAVDFRMGTLTDEYGRPIQNLRMPRHIVELIQTEALGGPMFSNESVRFILKNFVDKPTNWFKTAVTIPFPSFHFRNVLDATFRASLAIGVKSLNVKRNADMWNILTASKSGKMMIRGREVDYELIRHWFRKYGLDVDFDEKIGNVKVGLPGAADLDPRLFDSRNPNFIFGALHKVGDTTRNIAGKVDNTYRMSLFLEGLEQGMSPASSAQWAQKFLFDYAHGLTPFEREFMRRAFPFYTFMRFNIPLALEVMFKRPGMISAIGKTENLISTQPDRDLEKALPSYMRQAWNYRPKVVGSELQVWQGRNMLSLEDLGLITDLAFWRNEPGEGLMMEIINRANPILKIPIELGLGRNFFFDEAIMADKQIEASYLGIPGLDQWLNRRTVRVGDKTYARVDGVRWHLLQQGHLGRLYRAVNEMVKPDDLSALERFAPFFTGLRLASIDLSRRYAHLIKASNFMQADIVKALEEGDHVKARRLVEGLERGQTDQSSVEELFMQLKQMNQAGVLDLDMRNR